MKFAVGRFIHEMLDDMRSLVESKPPGSMGDDGEHSRRLGSNTFSGIDVLQSLEFSANVTVELDGRNLESESRQPSLGTKMILYSGHDATMVPLLCAMGLYKGSLPYK